MLGETIGRYEILEKLGEGGMGAVFKARDAALDRFVALKVLSSHLTSDPRDARRFEREAKAASALNHPNIAAIHDRGEHEGRPYLVFEYIPGGTLLEHLRRTARRGFALGPLLRFAVEAAEGLAHAHRRGVIHRDVKTDNMMLAEDGALKITDFGLALRSARDTSSDTTKGTAAYMSPEQGQGLELDARTDIFSFGIVLYELTAGELPYKGPHPASIVYDIIHTPMPSTLAKRPDLPPELDQIIQRATRKKRSERYQSMHELLADLRTLQELFVVGPLQPTLPERSAQPWLLAAGVLLLVAALSGLGVSFWPSIGGSAAVSEAPLAVAVLPFDNLSQDPARDYLADGLTAALISDLSKLPSLRVLSRGASLRYRGSLRSAPEIAADLKVERLVEGAVLQVGDRVRISVQLVDAVRDRSIWAESFDYELEDVLALQQDVAQRVARQVQLHLSTPAALPSRPAPAVDPRAYASYVEGRLHVFEWTLRGAQQARADFEHSLELEPEFAEAYAGLAYAYGFLSLHEAARPSELWPQARQAAEKALELDPALDQAHVALGFVEAVYDWNWAAAEERFRRALSLNPGSVDARHALAMTALAPQRRFEEATLLLREARQLDPVSPGIAVSYGDVLLFQGRFDEALREYGAALELRPAFFEACWGKMLIRLGQQDYAGAAAELEEVAPGNRPTLPTLLRALADGRLDRAVQELRRLEQAAGRLQAPWVTVALAATLVERPDRALFALEQAYDERSSQLFLVKAHPILRRLEGREGYQRLLERMNLADAQPLRTAAGSGG